MPLVSVLGYAASAAVLATFCMNTMTPLRVVALVSNILFIAYGFVGHLYPILILHSVLCPINALRIAQLRLLGQRKVKSILGGRVPIFLNGQTAILAASKVLNSTASGAVCVLEQNRLVGILSETDILQKVFAEGRNMATMTVGEVMTSNPRTISSEMALVDASALMNQGTCDTRPCSMTRGMSSPCCRYGIFPLSIISPITNPSWRSRVAIR